MVAGWRRHCTSQVHFTLGAHSVQTKGEELGIEGFSGKVAVLEGDNTADSVLFTFVTDCQVGGRSHRCRCEYTVGNPHG